MFHLDQSRSLAHWDNIFLGYHGALLIIWAERSFLVDAVRWYHFRSVYFLLPPRAVYLSDDEARDRRQRSNAGILHQDTELGITKSWTWGLSIREIVVFYAASNEVNASS
jgi:hypothetical protein